MDFKALFELGGYAGFAILFWLQLNKTTEKYSEQLKEILERHAEESKSFISAIEKNTAAIEKAVDEMGEDK